MAEQRQTRLITCNPGHFHAALLQKEMMPGISPWAYVYAPLDSDLLTHLGRIASFNTRAANPTNWQLEIYAGADAFERMLHERPGDVVILSGRNRGKIDLIRAAVEAGLHVLADKPWILETGDLPKLEATLHAAAARGVVAYDAMTQRFEAACILQRELVNDAEIFGSPLSGSPEEPAVRMESVHFLLKRVAGVPNLRPAWFFDAAEQGEGLSDVGTHLVDQVQWILFPEQAIEYARDIAVISGTRHPTILTAEQFRAVTGAYPKNEGLLRYDCNNSVVYTLRHIHVAIDVRWCLEAEPGGGDTHLAVFRGSGATVELRQGKEENYRPEVYVIPARPERFSALVTAVRRRVALLQNAWPGVVAEEQGTRVHVTIPEEHRIGHEAHFGRLAARFFDYVRNPGTLPPWEAPCMTAMYYVTTAGVEVAPRAAS